MGFIAFIIVLVTAVELIGDLSEFISEHNLGDWIGIAVVAAVVYKIVREWWDKKEEEHKKKLEEEDKRRIALSSLGTKVNLQKNRGMGDPEDEEEDSYFSSIQRGAKG